MKQSGIGEGEVNRFINDEIDTVPHLEALLLIWNSRPKSWSVEEVADWLFVSPETVKGILQDLIRRRLIVSSAESQDKYCYESKSEEMDRLIESVSTTYRRELVRVSNAIHAKASPAVREFARAFRFTKENQ